MQPNPVKMNVSRETNVALEVYRSLLLKWQRKINLISGRGGEDVWVRHFEDSAQLVQLLSPKTEILYDLGSGGGFPGLVLGVLTNKDVTLIESDSRKCSFLKAVSRETNSENIKIVNSRIENIDLSCPEVVTARALASLNELLSYCWDLWGEACNGVQFIFPKGQNWEKEVEEAEVRFKFDLKAHPSQTSPDSKILEISNLACA